MGVVHHSNYLRWMEEARIAFLSSIGLEYDELEAEGFMSPVIEANCKYKKATKFGETIRIETCIVEYNSYRITFSYVMKNEKGEVVCIGQSDHCFLSTSGKLLILRTSNPEVDNLLKENVEAKE